eukprot:1008920-Rhodomonas_salina.2
MDHDVYYDPSHTTKSPVFGVDVEIDTSADSDPSSCSPVFQNSHSGFQVVRPPGLRLPRIRWHDASLRPVAPAAQAVQDPNVNLRFKFSTNPAKTSIRRQRRRPGCPGHSPCDQY